MAIRKIKKWDTGGAIANAVPQLAGGVANAVVPGLGQIVQPLWQMVTDAVVSRTDNKLTLTPGKTTFGHGGALNPAGSTGVGYYNGKSHQFGGIRVTPNGTPSKFPTNQEVEGDETLVEFKELGTHIFSKRLKVQ